MLARPLGVGGCRGELSLEGDHLGGSGGEQQVIADRGRGEVVRLRADCELLRHCTSGGIECVQKPVADGPDEPAGDDGRPSRSRGRLPQLRHRWRRGPDPQGLDAGLARGVHHAPVEGLATGNVVQLANHGITCLVGANNAGKSQVLRDLLVSFDAVDPVRIALSDVSGTRPAIEDGDDVEDWMRSNGVRQPQLGSSGRQHYTSVFGGQSLSSVDFENWTNRQQQLYLGPTRLWFCWSATAGCLLGLATGSLGPSPGMAASNPLGRLYRSGGARRGTVDARIRSIWNLADFGSGEY